MLDLRDAFRALRASPVVSVVAILSLTLGIGANTAIFSILDSLTLRTLPVEQPGELGTITMGSGDSSFTNPLWEQSASARRSSKVRLPGHRSLQSCSGRAGRDDRRHLGQRRVLPRPRGPALLGRTFGPDDDRRGGGPAGPVAVVSFRFWQQRYAGAADVVGRSLTIERVPFTIVGVTGPGSLSCFTG